jgi:hypothetical protein
MSRPGRGWRAAGRCCTCCDQADWRDENPPPASGFRPAICLRWLLLPAQGDRAGSTLVPAFALSYRDVEELLAERGIDVDHTTIYRWVQRFTPLLAEAARPDTLSVTAGRPMRPT